jgi:hypothetical protein
MDYTNNPDGPPSNLHPNQHDYDELVTIYTHLDSFSTVGGAAVAVAATPGDTPSSWGTRIAGSAHGVATYVRDRGHGQADVTFVFWA